MTSLRVVHAALLALGIGATQAAPPGRIEVAYDMKRDDSAVATVTVLLEFDGQSYRLTESWEGRRLYALLGTARRVSRGTLHAGRLRPGEYLDERNGTEYAHAAFDWTAKTLSLRRKGTTRQEPLPEGADDRLTALFGLAFRPLDAAPLTLNVTDGRGLSVYVYEAAGRERVTTPAGEFDALKLVKRRDGPEDRSTEIWLALEHDRLPVRVLITEKDGERIEQLAARIGTP